MVVTNGIASKQTKRFAIQRDHLSRERFGNAVRSDRSHRRLFVLRRRRRPTKDFATADMAQAGGTNPAAANDAVSGIESKLG